MGLGGGVIPGGPGPVLPPADAAAARWVTRSALLAPLVVVVLALLSGPWPVIAVVTAILLLPLVVNRIRVLRRPESISRPPMTTSVFQW